MSRRNITKIARLSLESLEDRVVMTSSQLTTVSLTVTTSVTVVNTGAAQEVTNDDLTGDPESATQSPTRAAGQSDDSASPDYFIEIDSVKGESHDSKPSSEIPIWSLTWMQSTGGAHGSDSAGNQSDFGVLGRTCGLAECGQPRFGFPEGHPHRTDPAPAPSVPPTVDDEPKDTPKIIGQDGLRPNPIQPPQRPVRPAPQPLPLPGPLPGPGFGGTGLSDRLVPGPTLDQRKIQMRQAIRNLFRIAANQHAQLSPEQVRNALTPVFRGVAPGADRQELINEAAKVAARLIGTAEGQALRRMVNAGNVIAKTMDGWIRPAR